MAGRTAPDPLRPFSLDFTPLRTIREYHEIPRERLGRTAGVHPITIWRLESNRLKNPSMIQLVAIARALSVPIHKLYVVREPGGS